MSVTAEAVENPGRKRKSNNSEDPRLAAISSLAVACSFDISEKPSLRPDSSMLTAMSSSAVSLSTGRLKLTIPPKADTGSVAMALI